MTVDIVSVLCGGTGFTAPGITSDMVFRQFDNRCNHYTPCQLYQRALETSRQDIIIYAHDDLIIHDAAWLERVMGQFLYRDTAVVGLGGATKLGTDNLYKKPFDIWNMVRSGYMSNQDDWATHGEREKESRKVAVVDAFFMAVRRSFLELVGGWPVNHLTHHCLDLWLACQAERSGYVTYMEGVSCLHKGGGSSIKPVYSEAKWLQGGSLESDHALPHRWLAEEYRDVLPIEVG